MRRLTEFLTACFLAAPWMALAPVPAFAQAADVTVFAAASLKNALDVVAKNFEASTGKRVSISYAASSALARQIEQGAPADLFISADTDWMDHLDRRGLLTPGTRHNLLGNAIVLVGSTDGRASVALTQAGLAEALGDGRLAMAATASVPAGKYGKAALEKLGLWSGVAAKVAEAENVRAALAFVARGEAPLGIVYQTDAAADPKVRIVARFPADSHPPIIYPAAALADAKGPGTEAFRAALTSPAAARAFTKEGFELLTPVKTQ